MYVARYHWITFCQAFYSFSIYLKSSLHTYFILFHLGFYRPNNNSTSLLEKATFFLVSLLQNQFGRVKSHNGTFPIMALGQIYVLLTCKTFLARFVSFAALSWVYASQIVWNLTKKKQTNKQNKTKKAGVNK